MSSPETSATRTPDRPLEGRTIGISISRSPQLADLGLSDESINSLTVDLAGRIIALGGSVALGHDWRTGGVMEAVSRFALSYVGQSAAPKKPLILNFLAEPDRPNLSASNAKLLESMVEWQTFAWGNHREEILSGIESSARRTGFGERGVSVLVRIDREGTAFPRALDLSAMRCLLAQSCDVRVVVGGMTTGYQGSAPGVVEEAWWQLLLGKQLIVCGGLGGAACALLDAASPQAEEIRRDEDHPFAGAFLEDAWDWAASGRHAWTEVDELSVNAILASVKA